MNAVICLGNPGEKYTNTRHNAGFMVADTLTKKLKGKWHKEASSLVFHTQINGKKTIISKPQTYMNLSGSAAEKLIKKHTLKPENITLVYDDVDLPFGAIRVRKGGGTGGHNGVESVTKKLGTQDITRLRIGIGRPIILAGDAGGRGPDTRASEQSEGALTGRKPATGPAIANYVLKNFTPEEKEKLPEVIEEATKKLHLLLKFGYEEFASKYNK